MTIGPSKNVLVLPFGSINELIANGETARCYFSLKRTSGTGRNDRLAAERSHAPDIRPIVDLMRRKLRGPEAAVPGRTRLSAR